MTKLWPVPALGVVLAPLVVFALFLNGRYGLPNYHANVAIDLWQRQALYLVGLGLIAAFVGLRDRYLGLAVALGAVLIFYRGAQIDPTHTVFLALGALCLIVVRSTPSEWRPSLRWVLIAVGTFQAAHIVAEVIAGVSQPAGSAGHPSSSAAILAMTAPLMPWPLMLFAAGALALTYSRAAILALGIALIVKYRRSWVTWFVAGSMVPLYLAASVMKGWVSSGLTAGTRIEVWTFGLTGAAHSNPLFGLGLGGWSRHVPTWQHQANFFPTPERWAEAHNEYVQVAAELGLVGVMLAGLWLWSHRGMLAHATYGPSVIALAVDSAAWFPLHVVPVALVAIVVLGLAQTTVEAT